MDRAATRRVAHSSPQCTYIVNDWLSQLGQPCFQRSLADRLSVFQHHPMPTHFNNHAMRQLHGLGGERLLSNISLDGLQGALVHNLLVVTRMGCSGFLDDSLNGSVHTLSTNWTLCRAIAVSAVDKLGGCRWVQPFVIYLASFLPFWDPMVTKAKTTRMATILMFCYLTFNDRPFPNCVVQPLF
ncbi:hypothetical protein HRR83_002265 [Exophiala dermatitidis]|uniref:Uncharacterized protein n=1 Tax=Exophiala dermatitidis TaxID=5970 RepID=A0AAN6EW59_EXODE|nr:hypothetical protein HRR74_002342 [Exophiala dermatitidis]KAJ4525583.1 hypothetical protein HRR73_002313 [Exophiala dermatitidis]KAJ4536901.1 hypothetical protein HRR76_004926 [Exophiala dermatitidis]KAJ4555498.1 hypothetical protein HRR77_001429 [Exophiala dermatitidis]KAJ4568804.1 hypothetical protein HRR81_006461 [Exophiala dermatitidis]